MGPSAVRREVPVTTIYTDGACKAEVRYPATAMTKKMIEPFGMGGWAWYVDDDTWASGAEERTTNNRMEMLAVVKALEWATDELPGGLLIVSDSAYVVNCFADQWYVRWRTNGWVSSGKKPVLNRDLWEAMLDLYESYPDPITFRHCRGHGKGGIADAPHVAGNHQADRLAVAARLTLERDR